MLTVTKLGVVLRRSQQEFESQAVLNPGCFLDGDILHMFYRAVAPGNYSTIGYAQFKDNQLISRAEEPILDIEYAYEQHGLEDPRLIFCDGTYYLFYVVYDGSDAQVAYATATKLPHFTKQSIISSRLSVAEINALCDEKTAHAYGYFCTYILGLSEGQAEHLIWEKDAFLFPRKIGGKFALIYRFLPGVQVLFFDAFEELTSEFWLNKVRKLNKGTVLLPVFPFENSFIGGGCPPVETDAGWLLIYHAVSLNNSIRTYTAGAALLDLEDPTIVIGRLPYPLFSPDNEWEQAGDVPNVVFPTGAVVKEGVLYIYYGAADSCIACCTIEVADLVTELLNNPVTTTNGN